MFGSLVYGELHMFANISEKKRLNIEEYHSAVTDKNKGNDKAA